MCVALGGQSDLVSFCRMLGNYLGESEGENLAKNHSTPEASQV